MPHRSKPKDCSFAQIGKIRRTDTKMLKDGATVAVRARHHGTSSLYFCGWCEERPKEADRLTKRATVAGFVATLVYGDSFSRYSVVPM